MNNYNVQVVGPYVWGDTLSSVVTFRTSPAERGRAPVYFGKHGLRDLGEESGVNFSRTSGYAGVTLRLLEEGGRRFHL